MGEFSYVMVLVSSVIGLGIGHLLLGLGGIIDRLVSRRKPIALCVAYLVWHTEVFVWMALFWWWEFRFSELTVQWTIGLYFFLVIYAISLFLMSAVIVPSSWESVDDLGHFFLERRAWFYSLQFFANLLDIADSYLKGGYAALEQEPRFTLAVWVVLAAVCVIGIRTTDLRLHAAMAITVLSVQVISAFEVLRVLGV